MLQEKEMWAMSDALVNGGDRLYFEVGKCGRKDRFVLAVEEQGQRPSGVAESQTEPCCESLAWLWMLDEAVVRRGGEDVALLYSNSRKRGFCMWMKLKG